MSKASWAWITTLIAVQPLVALVQTPSPNLAVPEQVHLSLAQQPNAITITWATPIPLVAPPAVEYGKRQDHLDGRATGITRDWTYGGITRHTHTLTIHNLDFETRYYYQVGSNEQGWSHQFYFHTLPPPGNYPLRICVFGDLGYLNGTAMPYIQKGVRKNLFDVVIHVGDIAYDLHTDNGFRGDLFMRQIEPIAAYVPYMVVAGNHEEDDQNFTNYASRFNMPNCPFQDSQVYSVDVGPVHLLAISTEYHGYFYKYGMDLVFAQNEWLKQDLKKANANRKLVPWIVSYQHRPFYCSNQNSFGCKAFENRLIRSGFISMPGFEQILVDGGVDFGFWGHEHSYERFYPISSRKVYNLTKNPYNNAAAPIYIITGSAGCHSGHSWFDNSTMPGSAKRVNDYGYTLLHVHNYTHLHIQQISVERGTRVVDSVWVTKDLGHIPNTQFALNQPFFPFPAWMDDTGSGVQCNKDAECVQKDKIGPAA